MDNQQSKNVATIANPFSRAFAGKQIRTREKKEYQRDFNEISATNGRI